MRSIIHLVFLAVGFAGGIYIGVHYPHQAANIDQARADEQAKVAPQIAQAVAQAKIDLLKRLQGAAAAQATNPPAGGLPFGGSGFAGSTGAPAAPTNLQQTINDEMAKAQQELNAKK